MLKLNKDKTECIVFSSKEHVKKTDNLHIKVGSSSINSSMAVRNLGFILDNTLGIRNGEAGELYINYIIRKYTNDETCKTLLQNCAARLMTCTRKGEHITVLFQLDWLPVGFRSLYEILFHTFNVLSGPGPLYLRDLIEKYIPVRHLRSESYSLLRAQKCLTAM